MVSPVWATSSTMLPVDWRSATASATPVLTNFLKPCASTVTA